ncbi:uncharacterized protein LOC144449911 [Glandiceps talaboti]
MASNNPMSMVTTPEKTNHDRLSRLIKEGGRNALKLFFDNIHPPASLATNLSNPNIKQTLKNLPPKVLNTKQFGTLYPSPASKVTSEDFDITLFVVLLRNICYLRPPTSGWDRKPHPNDHSKEADIALIKFYRNELSHAWLSGVSQHDFETFWCEISDALVRLGVKKSDIDTLKTESMDSELELRYTEEVLEYAETERSGIDILQSVIEKVSVAREEKNYCTIHKGNIVELFCEKCWEPVCTTCAMGKHRGTNHEIADLTDIFPKLRDDLNRYQQQISGKESIASANITLAKELLGKLKVKSDAKTISATGKLENEVEISREEYDRINREINLEIERLDKVVNDLNLGCSYVNSLLQIDNAAKLVSDCRGVNDMIEKLMKINVGVNIDDPTNILDEFSRTSTASSTYMTPSVYRKLLNTDKCNEASIGQSVDASNNETHRASKTDLSTVKNKYIYAIMKRIQDESPHEEIHCDDHKKNYIQLYCMNCNLPICSACVPVCHRDEKKHKVVNIKDAAVDLARNLKIQSTSLKELETRLTSDILITKENIDSLTSQFEKLKNDIKECAIDEQSEEDVIQKTTNQFDKINRDLTKDMERLQACKCNIPEIVILLRELLTPKCMSRIPYEARTVMALVSGLRKYLQLPRKCDVLGKLTTEGRLDIHFPAIPTMSFIKKDDVPKSIKTKTARRLKITAKNYNGELVNECEDLDAVLKSEQQKVKLVVNKYTGSDATHTVTFSAKTMGRHELSVTLRDQHIEGSPCIFNVMPSWKMSRIPCRQYLDKSKQIDYAAVIALDRNGDIVVADWDEYKVEVIDRHGVQLGVLIPINLFSPSRVIVAPDNTYFITNIHPSRYDILVCNENGKLIRSFSHSALKSPAGIVINTSLKVIYVAGFDSHAVFMFEYPNGQYIKHFGKKGSQPGSFNSPSNVTINSQGQVLIDDHLNNRVQIFTSNGDFLFTFGSKGNQDGQFDRINGIATDKDDNVYVCDRMNNRIQIFDSKGNFLYSYTDDKLICPVGISLTDDTPCKILITDCEDMQCIKCYEQII